MAYYSKIRGIYHVFRNCKVGNNIEAENLGEGEPPGARLCKTCARLSSAGKGIIGTPIPAKVQKRTEVSYYYSKERSKIYHCRPDCYLGNNIEKLSLCEGQPPGAELCKNCARLGSADKGTFGMVITAE